MFTAGIGRRLSGACVSGRRIGVEHQRPVALAGTGPVQLLRLPDVVVPHDEDPPSEAGQQVARAAEVVPEPGAGDVAQADDGVPVLDGRAPRGQERPVHRCRAAVGPLPGDDDRVVA